MVLDGAGADVQLRCDLRVGRTGRSEIGDLCLLRREVVCALDGPPARTLAGRQELGPCALGECSGTHLVEGFEGGAQFLTCVDPPGLPPEPFAIDQVGASQLDRQSRRFEPLDGLAVVGLGVVAGEESAAPGEQTRSPCGAARRCSLGQTSHCRLCQFAVVDPNGSFDQIGEHLVAERQRVAVEHGDCMLGRIPVMTRCQVEHRKRSVDNVLQRTHSELSGNEQDTARSGPRLRLATLIDEQVQAHQVAGERTEARLGERLTRLGEQQLGRAESASPHLTCRLRFEDRAEERQCPTLTADAGKATHHLVVCVLVQSARDVLDAKTAHRISSSACWSTAVIAVTAARSFGTATR